MMPYYDATGTHFQLPSQQQYDYSATGPVTVPPTAPATSQRPSSGAWTPQDDQALLDARASGLNWGQIQTKNFPSKTPNACRKRHERLMDRKNADQWGARKLEILAREYMNRRREIWAPLAQATGEKWSVVEQKCMSSGLKNLQSAARAASRRERLESGQAIGYDDDSGVDGIGLTPVDDLDTSYSSPESGHSVHSAGSHHHAAANYQMGAHQQLQALSHGAHHAYGYPTAGHTYTSSMSSNGTNPGAYAPSQHSSSSSPYMSNAPIRGQRLSSTDMGIENIIHRTGQAS